MEDTNFLGRQITVKKMTINIPDIMRPTLQLTRIVSPSNNADSRILRKRPRKLQICNDIYRDSDDEELEDEYDVRPRKRLGRCYSTKKNENSSNKELICPDCKRSISDPDLRSLTYYPDNPEDETIIITRPELDACNSGMFAEPTLNITHFSVYDDRHHLCSLDMVMEDDIALYCSGFVKPLKDEEPTTSGGYATMNLGPITQWWTSGYVVDKNPDIGITTPYGNYYLLQPNDEYAPYIRNIIEKVYLSRLVISFIKENPNTEFDELVTELQTSEPVFDIVPYTKQSLFKYGQFIHDQVCQFDETLKTTPCITELYKSVRALHKNVNKKKTVVRNINFSGREKDARLTKAVTTPLVEDVFETFFAEQLDKRGNNDATTSSERCDSCHNCLKPDCGSCKYCTTAGAPGSLKNNNVGCVHKKCSTYINEKENVPGSQGDIDCKINVKRDGKSHNRIVHVVTRINGRSSYKRTSWKSVSVSEIHDDKKYYASVAINDDVYKVNDYVLADSRDSAAGNYVGQIMYMFEDRDEEKWFHVRWFRRASETILQEASDSRELFLSDDCEHLKLVNISGHATVHYSEDFFNSSEDAFSLPKNGRTFFYQKRYNEDSATFETIRNEPVCTTELNYKFCSACDIKDIKKRDETPMVGLPYHYKEEKLYRLIKWKKESYVAGTCIFIKPGNFHLPKLTMRSQSYSPERDEFDEELYPELYRTSFEHRQTQARTLEPFEIGCITSIYTDANDEIYITARKFYRAENTCKGEQFKKEADLNLLFWTEEETPVKFSEVVGKCYVVRENRIESSIADWTNEGPYRFYFNEAYDRRKKKFYDPPNDAMVFDKVGGKKTINANHPIKWPELTRPLSSLDVFAGCGGLTAGLLEAKLAVSKWAIEIDEPSACAFLKNNPQATMFKDDCNKFLKMVIAGEQTNENGQKFPKKGEIELMCGGPPCQGYSAMNRFTHNEYSQFKNSLITTYLSFCEYYRPRYFILENVKNFGWFRKHVVLKLTLRCLLRMGYQVGFAVLQAGHYGVPQNRQRLILVAAAPNEILPKFPEPLHVFNVTEGSFDLNIAGRKIKSTIEWRTGAPYRAVTVYDALSDLPMIEHNTNREEMPYNQPPLTHFQRMIRSKNLNNDNENEILKDHISKRLNPLILSRISYIPKGGYADWRHLPNKVEHLSDGTCTQKLKYLHDDIKQGKSSTGALRGVCACASGGRCNSSENQCNTLIPWCLVHTGNKHNHWSGLYGRVNWNGYCKTIVTNPEPMGKQGRVLHPNQDRIVSVRENARCQGFSDSYHFHGSVLDKYRQVGNAVAPPMATAIGRQIAKAIIQNQ